MLSLTEPGMMGAEAIGTKEQPTTEEIEGIIRQSETDSSVINLCRDVLASDLGRKIVEETTANTINRQTAADDAASSVKKMARFLQMNPELKSIMLGDEIDVHSTRGEEIPEFVVEE